MLVDSQLSMADHVASLCELCFFQLRQLRLVRSSLTDDSVKTLVHAFVSSRLDYCNSVLYSVSGRLLRKLQTVQNATARVVTRSRKFDHITPVLNELHWLPMVQRVRFKLVLIVFKCLHGLAPSYLTDDCILVSSVAGRRPLRSADTSHRRQELCSGWPTCVEQFAAWTANVELYCLHLCRETKDILIFGCQRVWELLKPCYIKLHITLHYNVFNVNNFLCVLRSMESTSSVIIFPTTSLQIFVTLPLGLTLSTS